MLQRPNREGLEAGELTRGSRRRGDAVRATRRRRRFLELTGWLAGETTAAGIRRVNAAGALQGKRGRENALGGARVRGEAKGGNGASRCSPERPESAKDGGG